MTEEMQGKRGEAAWKEQRDAVASDPEVKSFVERLEQTLDEAESELPPDRIPSADSIARDFQRFLRQRGPEGPSGA